MISILLTCMLFSSIYIILYANYFTARHEKETSKPETRSVFVPARQSVEVREVDSRVLVEED